MLTIRDSVTALARDAYGVTLVEEQTGGGCTALVGKIPGTGRVLVLSDGNLGTDLGAFGYGSASVYTVESWEDGGDPIASNVSDDAGTDLVWSLLLAALRPYFRP